LGKKISAGRSDRVVHAIKQRDQILEQISEIESYPGFVTFFDNYTARLTRINDRENQIFLKALLARLNQTKTFLPNISPEDKLEILETLLSNSHIFTRGSQQFHVPLEVSERYLYDIDKEALYSLLNSCRVHSGTSTHKEVDEEDMSGP